MNQNVKKHRIKTGVEFKLNEECIQWLKNLESPIGIISVAGMYRTGKSYLLNRMLLNRQKGFGVGPTINPCTKVNNSIRILGNMDMGNSNIWVHS